MDQRVEELLSYLYVYAEAYTVILSWVVVPLGIYVFYNFFQKHGELFGRDVEDR